MSHLSPQQVSELRKQLEDRLAKLEGITETLNEEHPHVYQDWANDNAESGEEALESYEQFENETLGNETDNLKVDIQKALERMKSGTYGKDEVTGQPIPYERLKLYPWATRNVQPETEQ